MVDLTVTNAGRQFLGIDRSRGPDQSIATVTIDVSGLIDPGATIDAARDAIGERGKQDVRWGQSNHPDLPAGVKLPCAFFGIPSADAARLFCETAFRAGTGSNAHILLEEVSEAIEAAHDPVHLRAELVQVAGVALKWIEQIDRRRLLAAADCACPAGVTCKTPTCLRLGRPVQEVPHGA